MSHRTARSSNIPIPTSSTTARNIEDVITMPFVASPGSLSRLHSPSRSLPPVISGPARSLSRPVGSPYEPRVIRNSPSRSSDMSCVASSPIVHPTRHRRPSPSDIPHAPISSPRNASSSRTIFNPSPAVASSSAVSFPRPAYLEHSALRHLLQTETPSCLPLSRYKSDGIHADAFNSAAIIYPSSYSRRERTPIIDSDDEGSLSPPRELAPPISTAPLVPSNPVLRIPTRWNDHSRNSLLSVSQDGRELLFVGSSCVGEKEAAAARTDYAIPPACGIYYYEVEILNKGQKGHISIGFSDSEVKLSRLPGLEKHSWGYHGGDGMSFAAEKTGNPYGPTYTTGDVIGCGVDFSQNKAFYTKNGALIRSVFDGIGKDCNLYPSIGLRHQTEAVRANFGHEPFQYDIEDHVHQQRNHVWTTIQNTPLDYSILQRISEGSRSKSVSAVVSSSSPENNLSTAGLTNNDNIRSYTSGVEMEDSRSVGKKTRSTIDKLVLSYLTHHGYAKTARAFKGQCEGGHFTGPDEIGKPPGSSLLSVCSLDPDDMDLRTKIVKSVVKGDIDTALEDTAVNYPGVFEKEQGLILFKLKCRKFVELLLEAAASLKRVRREEEGIEDVTSSARIGIDVMDGDVEIDEMDVDEDAFRPSYLPTVHANGFTETSDGGVRAVGKRRSSTVSTNAAQSALQNALSYGQQLEMDYKLDTRAEVRTYLKRTFSVVAYEDPLAVGGEVGEIAGQDAREVLASELNQAILELQGKPSRPALETVYRQTFVCLRELGLMGVAAAVFADMQKELIDT